jgi:hypothetical protein
VIVAGGTGRGNSTEISHSSTRYIVPIIVAVIVSNRLASVSIIVCTAS